ncbi:MAG TPA: hypothetical protein VHM92_12365 [Allosphingosinicella sp.]|nr:hypothetical protein [Allosphingosinicella sp.]
MTAAGIRADERTLGLPGVNGAEICWVASLPPALEGATRCTAWAQARPGVLLYDIPRVARMRISDGVLVEICPAAGNKEALIEQYLQGTARAVLVHQRGGLPLHAACLVPPGGGQAVAIAGVSGAGKSTLAAELIRIGWSLLGDDVTPLHEVEGQVIAYPSKAGVKLWRDACEALSIDTRDVPRVPGEREKYVVPAGTPAEAAPLAAIFLLAWGDAESPTALRGSRLVTALSAVTFKPHYIAAMGCAGSFLRIATVVAKTVPARVLTSSGPVSQRADLLTAACNALLD